MSLFISKNAQIYIVFLTHYFVEIQANSEQVVTPVEQKNIRRRVYDVLNVLMAMSILCFNFINFIPPPLFFSLRLHARCIFILFC